MTRPLVPVLLSGGAGTRLWPLSRRDVPKPLLALQGGRTQLQVTLTRLERLPTAPPWLVAGAAVADAVAGRLPEGSHVVVEPAGRGTAAAIGAVAALLRASDPLLLVLPTDHHVADPTALTEAIAAAAPLAERGDLVVFGVRATHPAEGLGWIVPGAPCPGGHRVARFVEKPSPAAASALHADGAHWNAGIFLFRASALLAELARHAPAIATAVDHAVRDATRSADRTTLGPSFAVVPVAPIDTAVFERTSRAAVVPLDAGWSDLGTFEALWTAGPRDPAGNLVDGDVVVQGTTGCLIRAEHRLVAAVGVTDLAIVETADAVLVAPRGDAQAVRQLATTLAAAGREETRAPARIVKPWGEATVLDRGATWLVKRLALDAGQALSLQRHAARAERWIVVSGAAIATVGDQRHDLGPGDVVEVPAGVVHRLEAGPDGPVEVIEVQTGTLSDADIERLEDRYGRR